MGTYIYEIAVEFEFAIATATVLMLIANWIMREWMVIIRFTRRYQIVSNEQRKSWFTPVAFL